MDWAGSLILGRPWVRRLLPRRRRPGIGKLVGMLHGCREDEGKASRHRRLHLYVGEVSGGKKVEDGVTNGISEDTVEGVTVIVCDAVRKEHPHDIQDNLDGESNVSDPCLERMSS